MNLLKRANPSPIVRAHHHCLVAVTGRDQALHFIRSVSNSMVGLGGSAGRAADRRSAQKHAVSLESACSRLRTSEDSRTMGLHTCRS